MKTFALIILGTLTAATAIASSGGTELRESAQTNIRSKDSLRDGARTYMNYCLGCHSMKYQRYSRVAEDLELTKDEMEENLILTGAKYTDKMEIAMTPEDSKNWFNKAIPPDLTVVAKARGLDWLYNYMLSFYRDDTRPSGWNNTVFENASMPHVLWQFQGIQTAHFDTHTDADGNKIRTFESFELEQPGSMSPEEYRTLVRNLVNFLDYSSEPAKLIRLSYAPWVLLFMALLTFMTFLLKKEYFKDVH